VKCLFVGVVMMEMADFYLGVCSHKVSDQDLEKVTTRVLETFDGVENLSAESMDGIAIFLRGNNVSGVLPIGFGESLLFQLIPGLYVELHNLGYSCYPKSPIVIVICPLNSLIECHMKELKHQGILCTCLPGDDADQDGRYSFKFALI